MRSSNSPASNVNTKLGKVRLIIYGNCAHHSSYRFGMNVFILDLVVVCVIAQSLLIAALHCNVLGSI